MEWGGISHRSSDSSTTQMVISAMLRRPMLSMLQSAILTILGNNYSCHAVSALSSAA